MITVTETAKNDDVYCRFIQFAVVNSCKLTFGRNSITTVILRLPNRQDTL
jgi:hypothetical protein